MGAPSLASVTTSDAERPDLESVRSGAELRRWYWLRSELTALARSRGLSTAGGKVDLTERLVASLDGSAPPAPVVRRPVGQQLAGPISLSTRLPPGQRSSQLLRELFLREIGPGFRFDGPMRGFVRDGAGRTLGEAVAHWHATRGRPRGEIAPQLELNRFLRRWHAEHPDGSRTEALDAWRHHRALPVDRRG